VGTVASRPGVLLAATDQFTATFVGRGGHGAYPHFGRDPIVTACEAVLNLQQHVSREVDPADSVVVTVGIFRAGTATNIIPEEATIEGTARTIAHTSRQAVRQAIERRCSGIAFANECKLRFDWHSGYPATVNEPGMTDYVARVARSVLGPERYLPVTRPSMGGEDFAYYLEKVQGCFFLVGVEPVDRSDYPSLHTEMYDYTDDAVGVGMRMFCELAARWGSAGAV
jgi:amidohydrolase